MLGWLDGPQAKTDNFRIVYENDEIAVVHQFMEFPSGDKEAVMMVYEIKNGKLFRITKLRTMYINAEKNGAQWAAANDKRIPKVILTKTPTNVSQIVVLNNTLMNSGSKKSFM